MHGIRHLGLIPPAGLEVLRVDSGVHDAVQHEGPRRVLALRVRHAAPEHLAHLKRGPLGPLGFDFGQHRQTLRPSVVGIRSKALRPFGVQ